MVTSRSATAALRQYTTALHWALNAFASNVFLVRSRLSAEHGAYILTPAGRDVVELSNATGQASVALGLELWCRVESVAGNERRWMLQTKKYLYRLEDPAERKNQFVAYHWHPDVPGIDFPHIHP